MVDDPDFGRDLAPSQNGHQRPLGSSQSAADDLQLLLDEEAGYGGKMPGHPRSGGMGPVDRAEGIRNIDPVHPGQSCQLFGKGGVVPGLPLLKAGVLEQHDLPRLQSRSLGGGIGTHHVVGQKHRLAQQLGQPLGHRLHPQSVKGLLPLLLGERGRVLPLLCLLFYPFVKVGLRLAQVGAGDDRRPLLQQIPDGGQSGHDALFIGNGAASVFGKGHIKVTAEQDLFPPHIHVLDGLLVVVHAHCPPSKFTESGPWSPGRSNRESRFDAGPRMRGWPQNWKG